jgi:nucleoside-triphosphatase THEP1
MRLGGLIYVVTGERGFGKTTVCQLVAQEAGRRGLKVAGVLTDRVATEQGEARQVVNLATGEGRFFGSQHRGEAVGVSDALTPGWDFDSGVFAWANEALACSTPCDLLVIDEIGPLELCGGRGWARAIEVLRSRDFHAALVVCRPGLVEELKSQLGEAPVAVAEVTRATRETLPATIAEALLTGPVCE